MRKSMCVLAAVAFVAVVNADINFWISETGITDPAQQFNKAPYDFLDPMIFDTTGGAQLPMPVNMGNCCDSPERVFFVWGEFTADEPWEETLAGLHLCTRTTGCMTIEDSVIYRHEGRDPQDEVWWQRWAGNLDLVIGPCDGPAVPVAVGADGIRYDYGINGPPPGSYDMRIYDPVTYHTRFLIGAIRAQCNCPEPPPNPPPDWAGELYLGLGTLGLMVSYGAFPDVYINDVLVQSGGSPPSSPQGALVAYCTPEPGSILLIAACGLLLRRR